MAAIGEAMRKHATLAAFDPEAPVEATGEQPVEPRHEVSPPSHDASAGERRSLAVPVDPG